MEDYIVLIIAIIIVVAMIIKLIIDAKNYKKDKMKQYKKKWGCFPVQEYTHKKMEALKYFYETRVDPTNDIDDTTWNDLSMDDIFMLLNHTESSIGEECLYD